MCLPPHDEEERVACESSFNNRAGHNHNAKRRPQLPRRNTTTYRRVVVSSSEEDDDRVTFKEEPQVHLVQTSLSALSEPTDRQSLWYSRDDIKEFRREAAELSKKCREDRYGKLTEQECTRGLELRMSLQRQDRKQMVVRRILDAQEDDEDYHELAKIAQEHSVWSRKLALAQAHKDYYAAYHPTLTSVLPEMPALLDCHRDHNKKRSLLLSSSSSPAQFGRRVRCRMF